MRVPNIAYGTSAHIEGPAFTQGSLQSSGRSRPKQMASIVPMPDKDALLTNGIFGFEPLDIRARSFMLLRAQLLSQFHAPGGRILAVTSTQAGNGKTYITANVAAAMSSIHPTVLLDLDLRRPSLAARFGIEIQCGSDDYLAGEADWPDVGLRLESSALTLYGIREPRRDSARLLASERMRLIVSSIRAMHDAPICIVDTPPILVVDDIMLIGRHVDGVLLIVEEGVTRSKDLTEALRILAPTPIVGSVLNKSLTAEKITRGYDYYDYVD